MQIDEAKNCLDRIGQREASICVAVQKPGRQGCGGLPCLAAAEVIRGRGCSKSVKATLEKKDSYFQARVEIAGIVGNRLAA